MPKPPSSSTQYEIITHRQNFSQSNSPPGVEKYKAKLVKGFILRGSFSRPKLWLVRQRARATLQIYGFWKLSGKKERGSVCTGEQQIELFYSPAGVHIGGCERAPNCSLQSIVPPVSGVTHENVWCHWAEILPSVLTWSWVYFYFSMQYNKHTLFL